MKKNQIFKWLNYILTPLAILLALYILVWPVDVIKNGSWKLTVQGDPHYTGDVITVTSSYTKLREVIGVAQRYLDCDNGSGGFVRYPVNQANANRKSGKGGTGIFIGIPASIPTPTKCKVAISVTYNVYPFRTHNEYNESDLFTVLPASERPSDQPVSVGVPEATAPAQRISPSSGSSSNPSTSTPSQTTNNTTINNPPVAQPEKQCILNLLGICIGG